MQGDNGVVTVAANSTTSSASGLNDVAAQKADLVRQFATASNTTDGGGGLIAQLSTNPFFTAVCIYYSSRHHLLALC